MRIVFIGTGEIGVPTLSALLDSEHEIVGVVTQPDKPVGRDQRIEAPPIKRAALLLGPQTVETPTAKNSTALSGRVSAVRVLGDMPILQPAKIKDRQAIEEIRALRPDVIVVMAYGQILSRDVLAIPTIACLNLHASLLPRWRGAAPIQYAIAAGDRETGITVMYMNEGLDSGDILLQRKIDILPGETGATLHERLAQVAPEALLEALKLFPNAPRIPQENSRATFAPKLQREDGRIDWKEPAEVIERKIRAFNPWPGALTKTDSGNLKIFSATIVDLSGPPGEVTRGDNKIMIAAGDHALSLSEVQLEGKRRMSAEDFARGQFAFKILTRPV